MNNKLFDSGVVDQIPKQIQVAVLKKARKVIGKGEDDWNTQDTCRAIAMLPEEFRAQFAGTDVVNFKNMMQRLRKDKAFPRVKMPPEQIDRFEKFVRDYKRNRERRGDSHLSDQYKAYIVNQSPEWRQKATEHKERCGFRCQLCGRESKLEVHHTPQGYKNLLDEQPWHLLALCADPCHPIADMLREGWFFREEAGYGLFDEDDI